MTLPGASRNDPAGVYIGLMSGTSLDGVDGVAVRTRADAGVEILAHCHVDFAAALKAELLALNASGPDELARAAIAGNQLARQYADVVRALRDRLGDQDARELRAIGAHGQTVRHRPGAQDGVGYTLQIQNPALLAELTGIDVIADFRSRDVVAGGQGAPLAPGFHQAMFAGDGRPVAVLNLGGIGNLTLLGSDPVVGYDCGPGNALLDHWCRLHVGTDYDDDGRWSAGGSLVPRLLASMASEPYLAKPPPKSTGRDLFNPDWLSPHLARHAADADPRDVQTTLAEFTAACAAQDLLALAPRTRRLIVCGGGALNSDLMRRLARRLPGWLVDTSDAVGLQPLQVEAAAFAWLAWRFVAGLPGNLPAVTGATGPRRLGAWYPAR